MQAATLEDDEATWAYLTFNNATDDYSGSGNSPSIPNGSSTATLSMENVSACFDLIVQAHRDGEDAVKVYNETAIDGVCTNVDVPEALVLSPPEVVLKGHVLIAMSSLALIANGTMLIIFYRRNYLKLSNYYLVFFLAMLDIMVATFCMLADGIWKLTFQWYGGRILCKAVKYFQMFSLYGSTYLLIAICCDRFVAVRWPHVSRLRGRALARIMIGCALLCSTLFAVPQALIFDVQFGPFFVRFQQCVVTPTVNSELLSIYHIASFLLQCIVPLTTIVVVYTLLFFNLWLESRRDNILKSRRKGSRDEQLSRCTIQVDAVSSTQHNSDDRGDEDSSNGSVNSKHLRTTSLYHPKHQHQRIYSKNNEHRHQPPLHAPLHATAHSRSSICNAEAMPYRSHNATVNTTCSIVITSDGESIPVQNGHKCYSSMTDGSPDSSANRRQNGHISKTTRPTNDSTERDCLLQPHQNGTGNSLHRPARTRKDEFQLTTKGNRGNTPKTQRREHKRLSETQSVVSGRRQELMRRAMSRSLLMSILIVGVFVVCWAPYYFDMYMVLTSSDRSGSSPAFTEGDDGLIFFFGMMSSLINPIIYGVFLLLRRKSPTRAASMAKRANTIKKDGSSLNCVGGGGGTSNGFAANGSHYSMYDSRQARQEYVRQQYLTTQRNASIASNNSNNAMVTLATTDARRALADVAATTTSTPAESEQTTCTVQPSAALRNMSDNCV